MAVDTLPALSPETAAMLSKYREELNSLVTQQQSFTGMAARADNGIPDPRILAHKVEKHLDALVAPMQAIERLTGDVAQLESLALQLFVSLSEALESGKPSTPYATPRPVTPGDWANWQKSLNDYREFINRIDV